MYQSHSDNRGFICPICGDKKTPLLPVGSEFPVLKELHVIGAGNRGHCPKFCVNGNRIQL